MKLVKSLKNVDIENRINVSFGPVRFSLILAIIIRTIICSGALNSYDTNTNRENSSVGYRSVSNLLRVVDVRRRIERRVQRDADPPVDADGRVEHPVQVLERHRALGLVVHVERQAVPVEVEQDSDRAARRYAALYPLLVGAGVLEPRAFAVYVHRPASVVLACRRSRVIIARKAVEIRESPRILSRATSIRAIPNAGSVSVSNLSTVTSQ